MSKTHTCSYFENLIILGAFGFVGQSLLPTLVQKLNPKKIWLVDPALDLSWQPVSCSNTEFFYFKNTEIPPEDGLMICLAGSTSVDAALDNPHDAYLSNTKIAVDVAEWLRESPRSRRLVYMSSDEVLGPSSKPLIESSPFKPTQPYAVSKAVAEQILINYKSVYDLDLRILRSCNLVGQHQRSYKLIPVAVDSLLKNIPIPVHGSGSQTREWMAVEDLGDALILVSKIDNSPPILQATSGICLSVIEVIKIVSDSLNIPLNYIHTEDRLVQDQYYSMSTQLLRRMGWRPSIHPEIAISRTSCLSAKDLYGK